MTVVGAFLYGLCPRLWAIAPSLTMFTHRRCACASDLDHMARNSQRESAGAIRANRFVETKYFHNVRAIRAIHKRGSVREIRMNWAI